jgi:uncharacterized protein YkwD
VLAACAPRAVELPRAGDPHVAHCLAAINRYRAAAGVEPLTLSDALGAFALEGSRRLAAERAPHRHFNDASADGSIWRAGFCWHAAENQAPDWISTDATEDAILDQILKAMMDEGPGGAHHDNLLDPRFARVGVGLYRAAGKLWLTTDFSPSCP